MKPIGPLMREHRLIERMSRVLTKKIQQMNERSMVDVDFLTTAVDFFRTYADRTHHGKEEDILFKELAKKQLLPGDSKIMNELVEEHVWARKMVTRLLEAKESYAAGNSEVIKDITSCLKELIIFYPMHIEKEDKSFFYPCLKYFSQQEQDNMLQEFWEFDRKLIHEKYQKIVEKAETNKV